MASIFSKLVMHTEFSLRKQNKQTMAEHNDTGKKGEELAQRFLKKEGYKILAVNWVFKKTEIDIVAQDEKFLIIAEVKTRHSNFFGEPESWVTKIKQQNLIKGAEAYILKNNLDLEVRFDIISIILSKKEYHIHHIKDAFYPIL